MEFLKERLNIVLIVATSTLWIGEGLIFGVKDPLVEIKKTRNVIFLQVPKKGFTSIVVSWACQQVIRMVWIFPLLKSPRQQMIERAFGMSSRTTVDWFSFHREGLMKHFESSFKLDGPRVFNKILKERKNWLFPFTKNKMNGYIVLFFIILGLNRYKKNYTPFKPQFV